MLKKIFALMLIAYSANAAEGSLLVQFRGFKGKNCEYRKDLAALFVDHSWVKQGKETLDTAWKKLSADALKDGQPIRLSLKELPENSEKNKI